MDRYEDRSARGCARRSTPGGFVLGIVIILAGTLMLLDNLGILQARTFWDYAPLILVALGLGKVIEAQGRPASSILGGLFVAAGALWFLENMDVLRFNARLIWPVLIIGFGLTFLIRAVERQRSSGVGGLPADSDAQVNVWTIFGAAKRTITAQDFRSADLASVFGGIEIDFRRSRILGDAVIDANAVFGGIDIKVPQEWNVEVRGSGIFGGYEDKTIHPLPGAGSDLRLIVTGSAVFGGVSVSN